MSAASVAVVTAQTTKVTGTVVSADDDSPVIGASVVVAGTTTGTVTDYNGAFTLDVPSGAKTLIISYIGMESVQVPVKPIISVVPALSAASKMALASARLRAMGFSTKTCFPA